ncbi:MAG: hypothetical protein NPIRA03_35290 [Nitrospirales bacterium]|nr:MAG: hypothetical protein NPIRA03_35290 [Nitrospirales bacterium]
MAFGENTVHEKGCEWWVMGFQQREGNWLNGRITIFTMGRMEEHWGYIMVRIIDGCQGRDRLMDVVYAEKKMEAKEFFWNWKRFL